MWGACSASREHGGMSDLLTCPSSFSPIPVNAVAGAGILPEEPALRDPSPNRVPLASPADKQAQKVRKVSGTAILRKAEPQIEQAANKKRCQSSDESLHRAQSWLGLEGKRRKIADGDQQFTNLQ